MQNIMQLVCPLIDVTCGGQVASNESLQLELAAVARRLGRMEDRENIVDVVYRYHHCLGALDRAAWLDCFAPDGIFQSARSDGTVIFSMNGRLELARWYDERLPAWPRGSEGHALVNPRIVRQDAGNAEVHSFFITLQIKDGGLGFRSYGDYLDHLAKSDDGKWRITHKRAVTRMTNAAASRVVPPAPGGRPQA